MEDYAMSLEPGGRSDKYGNNYENRYLAKLLLRLIKEELTSVIVEPLDANSNAVEFISEQEDGTVKHLSHLHSSTLFRPRLSLCQRSCSMRASPAERERN